MTDFAAENTVKVLAKSPGKYPVLVVQEPSGDLLAIHYETGYDLGRGKAVEASWVKENAVGRHSFIEVEPPEEVRPKDLADYAAGG